MKPTRFLVENDEAVTEGQPLAEVDKVSVMTAITGEQEGVTVYQLVDGQWAIGTAVSD